MASGGVGSPLPWITEVRDVPADQGGQVNVEWARSYLDVLPGATITHYSVWRSLLPEAPRFEMAGPPPGRDADGLRSYAWEWIADVPAHQFEDYALAVPTLRDSIPGDPGWHYFLVSAHTADPGVYYDSPPDSGYSVDNLAPVQPTDFAGAPSGDPPGLALSWAENGEGDLSHYALYRGDDPDFVPGPATRLAELIEAAYFDPDWSPAAPSYYKLSALDVHGNESSYAALGPGDLVGAPVVAASLLRLSAAPNPFTPGTTLRFVLGARGPVRLTIHGTRGERVRALVNEPLDAGTHAVEWDGRDDRGRAVAAGIYFARMQAADETLVRKIVRVR